VIAIIAILAAILFPVFAQAKDAAKDSSNLSNHKQAGLGILMYAGDFDDAFPIAANLNSSGPDLWWQDLVQPYIKNFDILLSPKRPKPTAPQLISFTRMQYMGMTPTPASASTGVPATSRQRGYYSYTGSLSGNHTTFFDGISGIGVMNYPTVPSGWLGGEIPAPSKTQTQIEGISDDLMVAEAPEYDFWWGLGDGAETYAFRYCVQWQPGATYSSYGSQWGYAAPLAMKRPIDGRSGINSACLIANGFTTYCATDGSAKAVNFRGELCKVKQRTDGSWIFPRLWSGTTN
jgi:type II secretory pathway pseudopilin PulG